MPSLCQLATYIVFSERCDRITKQGRELKRKLVGEEKAAERKRIAEKKRTVGRGKAAENGKVS